MTYVLIITFMITGGFYKAANPVSGGFAERATCESAGEHWKLEARAKRVIEPDYICLARQSPL